MDRSRSPTDIQEAESDGAAGRPLRALIVEDSADDCELLTRQLRRAGYDLSYERVERAEEMSDALDREEWDIVISDHSMPHFSGPRALEVLHGKGLDIPFILVSGTIGEETAVAAIRAGANDYLMKDNLARLAPAIDRELREAASRRERLRIEEERRRFRERARKAQKLEGLGVMAGGIAHDFNNLLMAILGNLDLAMMDLPSDSPARDPLERVAEASRRAADLSRQMLAYSGQGPMSFEKVDLSQQIGLMERLVSASVSANASLRRGLAENLPTIEADPVQIRQIVVNLTTNASEAVGEAPGVISISTGAMDCDSAYLDGICLDETLSEGRYVYLRVADTGCGMDPESLDKVFDPFHTTKFLGRGLGMAVVQGIARAHKGCVDIESEPGKGTTVTVLFPEAAAEAVGKSGETPQPAARATGPAGMWRGSGTVLLVDDEKQILIVGVRMLEILGMTAVPAANGLEALKIFRERPDDFDCVILDLAMPEMDGAEVLRQLREIRGALPVIVATGFSPKEARERVADATGVIQKPYRMAKLAEVLEAAIEKKQ